jgi:diadenosine tetraphosphatase ApaH/serine/threonine PP2A family protein phosphatase
MTVCGDIHGQLLDLFQLFRTAGEPDGGSHNYLFLGDYVDRGYSSLETFAYLAYFKIKYPNHFFLLRGNHESREVNQMYGLYNDCQQLYGHSGIWYLINSIFDLLPVAAVLDQRIFCVHGGLSPSITFIPQISTIWRKREIDPGCYGNGRQLNEQERHAIVDLTWSDPEKVSQFMPNRRGKGSVFGVEQTRVFLYNNGIGRRSGDSGPGDCDHGFIARSHQIAMNGYQWMHHERLVIVWSAPNYCYQHGNAACVMKVREQEPVEFVRFEKDPKSHIKHEDVEIGYFA